MDKRLLGTLLRAEDLKLGEKFTYFGSPQDGINFGDSVTYVEKLEHDTIRIRTSAGKKIPVLVDDLQRQP